MHVATKLCPVWNLHYRNIYISIYVYGIYIIENFIIPKKPQSETKTQKQNKELAATEVSKQGKITRYL